jgi:EpsI family protein
MTASHAPMRVTPPLLAALVFMACAWFLARWMVPTHYMADVSTPMNLEAVVPKSFGQWQPDASLPYIVANPQIEEQLSKLYSQNLTRTYVNAKGDRIMLTIAYGRNQNSNSTAAHRPEFCYAAQGFLLEKIGQRNVTTAEGSVVPAMRLIGRLSERVEPITYWVTLDRSAALPGFSRKWQQLKYGLQGKIADGMLVRISTIGDQSEHEFAVHDQFIGEWRKAMPPDFEARFFGS